MKKMLNYFAKSKNIRRNSIIVFGSILVVLAVLYDVHTSLKNEADDVVEGISESLIRFHVIANSDSNEDQNVKLKVKNAIIIKMQELLKDAETINESREIITKNMSVFEELSIQILRDNGISEEVKVTLKQESFPLKQYGDVVLPPGEYEALVIRIGKAEGKNWWCVLFPPLCFVDATHGVIDDESKKDLQQVLTEEEYNSIINNQQDTNIKVKSKFFEWFEKKEDDMKSDSMFASFFD